MRNSFSFFTIQYISHFGCDLLHMQKEEITYIEVTNPIELGDVLDDKEFHLDVHVNLNNETDVNLRRIDLATEEDKAYRIDLWAKMFKAKTWEEMHMLAVQDKEIDQAASSMWQLTEDRKIREQIRRREANINAYNRKEKMIADAKAQVKALKEQLKTKDDQLKAQDLT